MCHFPLSYVRVVVVLVKLVLSGMELDMSKEPVWDVVGAVKRVVVGIDAVEIAGVEIG